MATGNITHTWRLVVLTQDEPLERKATSKGGIYADVEAFRDEANAGQIDIKSMAVYEWNRKSGRWMLCERPPVTLNRGKSS